MPRRFLNTCATPHKFRLSYTVHLSLGGEVVLGEPQWDTLSNDRPETAITRAHTRYLVDRVIRNASVGRELHRLLLDVGFSIEDIVPTTDDVEGFRGRSPGSWYWRNDSRTTAAGYLTVDQAERFLYHVQNEHFFEPVTFYILVAIAEKN